MRIIRTIVIHCADTPNGQKFTRKDIDSWHHDRGFRRSDTWREFFNPDLFSIGYHYVINVDGTVETGRSLDEVGAHVQGANSDSVGICMIGRDKFKLVQWGSLGALLTKLCHDFPGVTIKGHCEFPSAKSQGKTCPNFDVSSYVIDKFKPDDKHIFIPSV